MRKLPVIPKEETPAQQALRRRINFANRPRIDVGIGRLDEVSAALARSAGDRGRFIKDPAGYLRAQELPVSSCQLVRPNVSGTSEVCSANAVCNVNAFANVNAATKVNAALAVNLLTLSNVVNTVYVYNKVNWWGYEQPMEMYDVVMNNSTPYGSGIL